MFMEYLSGHNKGDNITELKLPKKPSNQENMIIYRITCTNLMWVYPGATMVKLGSV